MSETTRTLNAQTWAKSFNETLVELGYRPHDEDWLTSWFANAIMCGFDEANRQAAERAQATEPATQPSTAILNAAPSQKGVGQGEAASAAPAVDDLELPEEPKQYAYGPYVERMVEDRGYVTIKDYDTLLSLARKLKERLAEAERREGEKEKGA